MIKLESLSKHFGKAVVLDGIDLAIEEGEIVVIIGPSGTGKSTLLRCVNFLEQPTKGTMTVGDLTVDVNRASRADILSMRRRTAFVFPELCPVLQQDRVAEHRGTVARGGSLAERKSLPARTGDT